MKKKPVLLSLALAAALAGCDAQSVTSPERPPEARFNQTAPPPTSEGGTTAAGYLGSGNRTDTTTTITPTTTTTPP